ncbi:hypothetical protein ABZX12_18460 [Kribbella sp. NPDC003505]|uniref:hypothetical protein n=1 Tax=Kribbella sp. NPDC003505 TaxID=3154448 RepID=UPI0033B7C590
MHHTQEPPIPRPEHYELSYAAAHPSRFRRALRWADRHPGWIVTGLVAVIAAVPVYVIAHDNPARGAADHAAVVAKPAAAPPARNAPEYSPPLPDQLAGDGMWIVGKQMKPGVYQSDAGVSCYWERLAGLSGTYEDLLDNGGFRRGPKLVEVRATDFAFTSQGCGLWVMVR